MSNNEYLSPHNSHTDDLEDPRIHETDPIIDEIDADPLNDLSVDELKELLLNPDTDLDTLYRIRDIARRRAED